MLRNGDARVDVQRIGVGRLDARGNLEVGGGGNHGGVVAGESRVGKIKIQRCFVMTGPVQKCFSEGAFLAPVVTGLGR